MDISSKQLKARCTSVAGRYALALFAVAKEKNTLDMTLEECCTASALMAKGQRYRLMMIRMFQGHMAQLSLEGLEKCLGFQDFMMNFLKILAENKRISCLKDICRLLRNLVDDELNRLSLVVYSSIEIGTKEQNDIRKKLEKIFKKSLLISYELDKTILGGLVIRTDSVTIDSSGRHQIEKFMSTALEYFK